VDVIADAFATDLITPLPSRCTAPPPVGAEVAPEGISRHAASHELSSDKDMPKPPTRHAALPLASSPSHATAAFLAREGRKKDVLDGEERSRCTTAPGARSSAPSPCLSTLKRLSRASSAATSATASTRTRDLPRRRRQRHSRQCIPPLYLTCMPISPSPALSARLYKTTNINLYYPLADVEGRHKHAAARRSAWRHYLRALLTILLPRSTILATMNGLKRAAGAPHQVWCRKEKRRWAKTGILP